MTSWGCQWISVKGKARVLLKKLFEKRCPLFNTKTNTFQPSFLELLTCNMQRMKLRFTHRTPFLLSQASKKSWKWNKNRGRRIDEEQHNWMKKRIERTVLAQHRPLQLLPPPAACRINQFDGHTRRESESHTALGIWNHTAQPTITLAMIYMNNTLFSRYFPAYFCTQTLCLYRFTPWQSLCFIHSVPLDQGMKISNCFSLPPPALPKCWKDTRALLCSGIAHPPHGKHTTVTYRFSSTCKNLKGKKINNEKNTTFQQTYIYCVWYKTSERSACILKNSWKTLTVFLIGGHTVLKTAP